MGAHVVLDRGSSELGAAADVPHAPSFARSLLSVRLERCGASGARKAHEGMRQQCTDKEVREVKDARAAQCACSSGGAACCCCCGGRPPSCWPQGSAAPRPPPPASAATELYQSSCCSVRLLSAPPNDAPAMGLSGPITQALMICSCWRQGSACVSSGGMSASSTRCCTRRQQGPVCAYAGTERQWRAAGRQSALVQCTHLQGHDHQVLPRVWWHSRLQRARQEYGQDAPQRVVLIVVVVALRAQQLVRCAMPRLRVRAKHEAQRLAAHHAAPACQLRRGPHGRGASVAHHLAGQRHGAADALARQQRSVLQGPAGLERCGQHASGAALPVREREDLRQERTGQREKRAGGRLIVAGIVCSLIHRVLLLHWSCRARGS